MGIKRYFNIEAVRLAEAGTAALYAALQFLFLPANAAGSSIDISTPDKIVAIICGIAGYMFWILIVLSTVMVLVGAFKYVTAGGDAEKVKSATKTITYAAVGIVVALLAKGFPFIVASVLGGDTTGIKGC